MSALNSARLSAVSILVVILVSAFSAKASLPVETEARPSLDLQARLLSAARVQMPRSVGIALTNALYAQGMSRAVLISDENGNLISVGEIQEASRNTGPLNPCCQGDSLASYIEVSPKLRRAIQELLLANPELINGAFTLNANGELVKIGERHELEQFKQDALRIRPPKFKNIIPPLRDAPTGPPGEG